MILRLHRVSHGRPSTVGPGWVRPDPRVRGRCPLSASPRLKQILCISGTRVRVSSTLIVVLPYFCVFEESGSSWCAPSHVPPLSTGAETKARVRIGLRLRPTLRANRMPTRPRPKDQVKVKVLARCSAANGAAATSVIKLLGKQAFQTVKQPRDVREAENHPGQGCVRGTPEGRPSTI